MKLTYKTPDGSWGVKGVNSLELAHLQPKLYVALMKLRDLEYAEEMPVQNKKSQT